MKTTMSMEMKMEMKKKMEMEMEMKAHAVFSVSTEESGVARVRMQGLL